jgi:hypothetical protein
MSHLPPDLGERRSAPIVCADAALASHLAERAAQGLPAHLGDPAVAAQVVALLMPATTASMVGCSNPGKVIGRPPVTARPGFAARWERVRPALAAGPLSRRQAARRLKIGTATLGRLLAADPDPGAPVDG